MRRVVRGLRRAGAALVGELDTIAFFLGAGLIVKGVSMIDDAGAYIVAGVLLCGLVFLSSRARPA